jgi:hypothetical protein
MASVSSGSTRKAPPTGLLLAAVFLVAALAAAALWPSAPPAREPFDATAWKGRVEALEETGDAGCVRGGMAVDLIESRVLVGATATQVVERLGSPDKAHGAWRYAVGQCGRWWEQSALVLTFDAGARVAQASLQ